MTECPVDEEPGSQGEVAIGKKGSWARLSFWTRNIAYFNLLSSFQYPDMPQIQSLLSIVYLQPIKRLASSNISSTRTASSLPMRLTPCPERKWKKQGIIYIEDPEDRFSEKELSCLAKGQLNLLDLESVFAALPMIGRSNLQTRPYGSDESYQVVVQISHPFYPTESEEEVRKSLRQRIRDGCRWIRKRLRVVMRSQKLEV